MAEHKPQFNLYSISGAGTMKFIESHPKLDATGNDFAKAGQAINEAYGFTITEATLQSETTVYTAG